jgi:putative oxidoreductase
MFNLLLGAYQRDWLPSVGLAALRVVMGWAFALHGWPKFQHAFTWMGAEAPVPGILQAFAAGSEFIGGILLALGLLTPLASLSLVGVMLGAIFMAHVPAGHPFVDPEGGHSYELALVYLSGALVFLLNGPGRLSLDSLWLPPFRSARGGGGLPFVSMRR